MNAELHCHSLFSVDGRATPEQIVEGARAAGATTLSLTDHNSVEGLPRANERAAELGIRFIDGLEMDMRWRGGAYHAIAFGFDPRHAGLREACARNWGCYELHFSRWAPIIERHWGIGSDELRAALPIRYPTVPAPSLNRWFARDYMVRKGVFPDWANANEALETVAREAEAGLRPEEIWPFAPFEEVRDAVHAAGGILLLAHVGHSATTRGKQLELIDGMLEEGMDGFELYHAANTRFEHFPDLVAHARSLGCAVSGGSDCHDVRREGSGGPGTEPVPGWAVPTIHAALAARRGGGAEPRGHAAS